MMADNLGYGDLGVYGGGETRGMPTPRIDQLASDGLQFTQFLVEPGCTPTRAATMPGRYSIRSGLSLALVRGTPNTLADEEYTMAEMFKDMGYDIATSASGTSAWTRRVSRTTRASTATWGS